MRVLFFTSPACGPCKMLKPIMKTLQKQRGFHMDTFEASKLVQSAFEQYGVRAAPTVIVVDADEREVGRFSGAKPQGFVEDFLTAAGVA